MSATQELADHIKSLSPPDQLRAAALLIEQAKTQDRTRALSMLGIARSIAELVSNELSGLLLLARTRGEDVAKREGM